MSWLQALVLAIVQGLTEFLPVSSSGHLALFGRLFRLPAPDISYDVMLHLATLVAVVLYYRNELAGLAAGLFRPEGRTGFAARPWRFLLFVVLSTIPTGLIGLSLDTHMTALHDNLFVVGICFLATAAILFLTHRHQIQETENRELLDLHWTVPVLIGIAQGIAVLPGISRSGATIGCAILLGTMGRQAASYAFLVSIPAIFGAFLLKLPDLSRAGLTAEHGTGFVVALVVGMLSIRVVEKVVEHRTLNRFAVYVLIGALVSFGLEMLT